MASLPALRRLYLNGHGLTGERVALLANSVTLQWLQIPGNPLSDEDIPHLASLKNLRFLDLN
ncbi:MAG: hypothetical protein KDA76_14900 [Planctomycetaceae bacterium]|nr:hypothetical protein [Planctomycetaceae bacterium]